MPISFLDKTAHPEERIEKNPSSVALTCFHVEDFNWFYQKAVVVVAADDDETVAV
jgi:hypothetical protein